MPRKHRKRVPPSPVSPPLDLLSTGAALVITAWIGFFPPKSPWIVVFSFVLILGLLARPVWHFWSRQEALPRRLIIGGAVILLLLWMSSLTFPQHGGP
jgi:hypothetical protein